MENQSCRFAIRLNKSELNRLDAICEMFHCSRAAFFRAAINVPIVSMELDDEMGIGFIPLYDESDRELARQVQKIGVNYNQAVKGINIIAERQFLREREMQYELDNIFQMLSDIQESILEIEETNKLIRESLKNHREIYLGKRR